MGILRLLLFAALLSTAACADPAPNEWRGETHFE